ncbi:unnamed protein product [Coregonus sp. 'balchen']|nr:unnamed protein product [Coregonus sp. 'balchen']
MEQNNGETEGGNLAQVQHVVLILSGKGGVGKSTLTTELALALRHAGKKVGILDVDLCGPSIPRMLSVGKPEVHQCDSGWVPVYTDAQKSLALMSIAFLLEDPDEAVIWRGPKKTALIGQFVSDVAWGELDVLLVDTPPGTSDEHLAVLENLKKQHKVDGAILITTPQVQHKEDWCCSVPLDPLLTTCIEEGKDFIQTFPESATFSAINSIAKTLLTSIQNP